MKSKYSTLQCHWDTVGKKKMKNNRKWKVEKRFFFEQKEKFHSLCSVFVINFDYNSQAKWRKKKSQKKSESKRNQPFHDYHLKFQVPSSSFIIINNGHKQTQKMLRFASDQWLWAVNWAGIASVFFFHFANSFPNTEEIIKRSC